jgi:RNase H-fold protein (predicted Holliday junction resolvase)
MISEVIAIDPGRFKCGIAVVSRQGGILERTIIAPDGVQDTVAVLAARFKPQAIIIGNGTNSALIAKSVEALSLPVHMVDETHTTLRARKRYFADNEPRGWRRIVPRGLLTPPVPFDDYAAVIMAEDFLSSQSS